MKKYISLCLALLFTFACVTTSSAAVTKVNLAKLIADKKNWTGTMNENYAKGQVEFGKNYINMKPGAIKSAAYTGAKYKDFELSFKLKITWPEDSGDWGAVFTFRDQSPGVHVWEGGKKPAYGLFFGKNSSIADKNKSGVISFRRWVNSDGDTGPEPIVAGKDEAANIALDGKEHLYKLVVSDVSNGVSMTLYIDNKKAISVTDTSKKAIKTAGGFMLLNHGPRGAVLTAP